MPLEDELRPKPARQRRRPIRRKEIERVEKMRRALELRKRGLHMDQIAKELGYYDSAGASKLVRAALRATIQETADEVRRLEVERLDQLYKAALPGALKGEYRLIEQCINIMDRRAQLLGLDAPSRVTVDATTRNQTLVIDATQEETRNRLYDLLRQRPAQQALDPGEQPGGVLAPALPDVEGEGVLIDAG